MISIKILAGLTVCLISFVWSSNSFIELRSVNYSLLRGNKILNLAKRANNVKRLSIYAGKGYNIFLGNPKSNLVDPGFRNQIFNFTYNQNSQSDDGKYEIPDNVIVNNRAGCEYLQTANEYFSSIDYQKDLRNYVSLGGSYDNFVRSVSFSSSADFVTKKASIENEKNVVLEYGEKCERYKVEIAETSFQLHSEFKNYIKSAYNGGDKTWQNLIEDYGTHYISTVVLGGRVQYHYYFSSRSITEMKTMGIDVKTAAALSFKKFNLDMGYELQSNTKKINTFLEKKKSYSKSVVGGQPNDNLTKWISSLSDNPMPIFYTIKPLVDLISPNYFPEYNAIDLDIIKENLNNSIKDFCNSTSNCKVPSNTLVPTEYINTRFSFSPLSGGREDGYWFIDDIEKHLYSKYANFNSMMTVKRITICSGVFVDSIQLTLSDGITDFLMDKHGGNGGGCSDWNVPSGEYITQIEVWSSVLIDSINFITNKGSRSGRRGGSGGGYFLYKAQPDSSLISLGGKIGSFLNGIQFIWKKNTFDFNIKKNYIISSEPTTNLGYWGDWDYCDPNTYAVGFQTKIHKNSGDKTALNQINIHCKTTDGKQENRHSSAQGPWGDWNLDVTYCDENRRFNGFQVKVQNPQGDGDDTAMNAIRFSCEYSNILKKNNEQIWGDWQDLKMCPPGTFICAIQTQLEPELTRKRDDTAINNVSFRCCY